MNNVVVPGTRRSAVSIDCDDGPVTVQAVAEKAVLATRRGNAFAAGFRCPGKRGAWMRIRPGALPGNRRLFRASKVPGQDSPGPFAPIVRPTGRAPKCTLTDFTSPHQKVHKTLRPDTTRDRPQHGMQWGTSSLRRRGKLLSPGFSWRTSQA